MLVRALEACFLEGSRRRKGAEFDYTGDPLPACLVPIETPKEETPKVTQKPIALSEMANQDAKPTSFIDSVKKKK